MALKWILICQFGDFLWINLMAANFTPHFPFFPPTAASFKAEFLNYSSCRQKIKIKIKSMLRRQLKAVWEAVLGKSALLLRRVSENIPAVPPSTPAFIGILGSQAQSLCSYSPSISNDCKVRHCREEAEIFTHQPLKCHRNPIVKKKCQYINV